MITTIVILALVGSIIAAVVGTFWYSPLTPMGRLHMQYLGFDKLSPEEQKQKIEEAKPTMWKIYALQMVLSFLTAFAVVFIITLSVFNGVPFFMAFGFVAFNWLCFIVPTIGAGILWSNCDRNIAWKRFISDISCSLTTLLLVSLMTSFFI